MFFTPAKLISCHKEPG